MAFSFSELSQCSILRKISVLIFSEWLHTYIYFVQHNIFYTFVKKYCRAGTIIYLLHLYRTCLLTFGLKNNLRAISRDFKLFWKIYLSVRIFCTCCANFALQKNLRKMSFLIFLSIITLTSQAKLSKMVTFAYYIDVVREIQSC